MEPLCVLIGAALLFVVVGSVIYTLASLLGGGRRRRDIAFSGGDCPLCATPVSLESDACPKCGFPLNEARYPTLANDFEATKRQLNRLASSGQITDAAKNEILDGIRRDVLARAALRTTPAAAPVSKPSTGPTPTVPTPAVLTPTVLTPTVPPTPARESAVPPTVAAKAVPPPPPVAGPIEVAEFAEEAETVEMPQPVEPAKTAEPVLPVAAARAVPKPWVTVPTPPLVEPAEPRSFARIVVSVLQSFMEESNIRWGELVSGLLIVISSVGLVISLWATLEKAIPYFPVAVFLAATAAMHGAGLYTLKYWRLKTTSRGLLLVSTLLVPLNVLAAIALNDRKSEYFPIDYAAVTVGLIALAAIVYSAARNLNKHHPWPMFLAVMGGAVGSSYIGRLASPGASEGRILLLFALPFASFAVAAVAQVRRLAAGRRLAPRRAAESFRFFGIGLFALVIAAGLLAWKAGNVLGTLSLLAPLLSLLGALLTATGLVVQGRMSKVADAGYRTAGTAIALGGGLVVLAAVVLAWPRPDLLVEVGLLNAFAFAALAWVAGMPELHLFATASFSLACLIGFDLATGRISIGSATSEQLTQLLLDARSALILTILSLVIDGVALALRQTKAVRHAAGYFASAMLHAGVAVAIAALAIFRDVSDQNLATGVFLLLALRWLSAAWWIRRPYATWFASGLLLAAIGHGLAMNSAVAEFLDARNLLPADPWTVALLVHATICMAYAVATAWRAKAVGEPATRAGGLTPPDVQGDRPLGLETPKTDDPVSLIDFGAERSSYDALVMPLGIAALVVSALAVPSMLNVTGLRFFTHAGYAGVIGAIWLAAAFLFESPVLAGVAQVVGTAGVVLGVTGHCRHQDWWTGRLIEPLFLNWQLSALAVWCGLWIALRQFVRRWPVAALVLRREPVTVDRIVLGAVVALLAATCLLAVAPGIVAQESLVAQGSGRALPFYLLVVMPFLIGAIATGARAFFGKQGIPAAVAFGLGIVAVVCFARVLVVTSDSLWPGFPSPYGQGWGAGAWLALALVALSVVAAHWERPTRATFGGFAALLATLPYLVACHWDNEASTASALAWGSGLAALAVSLLWSCRGPIGRVSRQLGWTSPDAPAWRDARAVRDALVASTGFTLLAIVAGNMVTLLGRGLETVGPFEGSFFAGIGPAATDAVPLLLLAASFVVYAVGERKALWGLSATFLAQCAWGVFIGYAVARADHAPHLADFVRFVEQMGLSAAVAAVCWMAIDRLAGAGRGEAVFAEDEPRLDFGISIQFVLAALFAAGLAVGATAGLWSAPGILMESVKACGSPLGWSLLALAAGIWCMRQRGDWPLSAIVAALGFLAAAAPLAAASLSAWNGPHNWLSFHTAIAGWCGVIGITVVAAVAFTGRRRVVSEEDTGGPELPPMAPGVPPGREPDNSSRAAGSTPAVLDSKSSAEQRPPALRRRLVGLVGLLGHEGRVGSGRSGAGLLSLADWTLFLTPLVVLFAIRGLWDDPLRPWWSAGPAWWLSLSVLMLAAVTGSQRRAFLSLGFAVLGSVIIGLRPWLGLGQSPAPVRQDVLDLVHITLIGAALHALVWSVVTIVRERRRPPDDLPLLFPLSHHVVALIGTIVAALPALAVVSQRIVDPAWLAGVDVTPATPLGWTALGLLAALCVVSFGERTARHGLPLLYVLGLTTLGISLTQFVLSRHEFIVVALCSLAGYVVITGAAWSARRPLRAAALRWGAAGGDVDEQSSLAWLSTANAALCLVVILSGFWIVLNYPESQLRITAALATLALAPGVALLATKPRERFIQMDALVVGAIAAAQIGWALMELHPEPHEALRRTIRLLVSLAATAFVYGVPLVRLVRPGGTWFASIRRATVIVAATAVVALGLILLFEFQAFDPAKGLALSPSESVVVAVALVALAAGLISLAVLPGSDPFLSSERERFFYVYGSEVVAGLLFAHIYLTDPVFFRGLLQPYWPLVVMGIAFVGTGISELFGRFKVNVLAKPLEHTAAFLPVLPVLGFWLVSSNLQYSTTLFVVGVLYLILALRRGSFAYSAAAAIAGNATVLALFAEHGVSLLVHPQMFIIPPCVTILAAAQLNRDRLEEGALASIRYFAITTIYVSSTGEMFQHGIGTTLWLPMVLAGLSVLGVLAGMMLRVRAFLYLGTSFLILSLVSMVWHAARSIGQVWPWWVFGFTLGLALLTLFGIFEKKRAEMLLLIERLKEWEK